MPHSGGADSGAPVVVRRKRVLFFAEAVTLAHVARVSVLAASLDPTRYEAVIACRDNLHPLLPAGIRRLPLDSIDSSQFVAALARGGRVFSRDTLRRYVDEDRRLMVAESPDLVVGDFRISLSASARLEHRPYAAICNAYWSPFAQHQRLPLPELPMTHFLPLRLADALFQLAMPVSMAWHAAPLQGLRRELTLPKLPAGLRAVYTDADHVLYADVPELFPTQALPESHQFLGPIFWEPPVHRPQWWADVPTAKPWVYVTMGSSGQASVLDTVLDALADLPVTTLAAAARDQLPAAAPANAFAAKYLPGTEVARRSAVVVCNGGSLTCQQALVAGVPVLGIASNMDQFMNMEALVRSGAGVLLRADRLSRSAVLSAVQGLLDDPGYSRSAREAAVHLQGRDAGAAFARFVSRRIG